MDLTMARWFEGQLCTATKRKAEHLLSALCMCSFNETTANGIMCGFVYRGLDKTRSKAHAPRPYWHRTTM